MSYSSEMGPLKSQVVIDPDAAWRGAAQPQSADFRRHCEGLTSRDLSSPEKLYRWSVSEYREFWRTILDWTELAWEGAADVVCTSDDVEHAVFFPDVRLNYAENLLRSLPGASDGSVALTAVHGDGTVERITRGALRQRVASAATTLATHGVTAGDRVVVVGANNSRVTVATLAVAALGAAVSTAMPDMGSTALLGRFEQVEPAVLLIDRSGAPGWAGVAGDTLSTLLAGLATVRSLVVLDGEPLPALGSVRVGRLDTREEAVDQAPAPWPRRPFNAPLFVMFSSGTTGPPKAMVHGIGGTLLEHVKEHRLHVDLRPSDTLYFHTTTAWMMWNWQLSALAVGAHIVLYDGPVSGPATLWELVAAHGVTVFGTSPAYLQLCQDDDYRPTDVVGLSRLRAVLSTGAVLQDWQFDWVTDAVGPVPLQSISGGTDIVGCFVLGSSELPVRRGRAQSRSLGLDVAAVDEDGCEVIGAVGELVCRRPFPSRPVGFLRDPDGERFHASYFAEHPGVWTHGDLVDFDPDGSARLHGRTDGVLNVDGVRIGPAEIYTVLHRVPEIAGAMAVEQRGPDGSGAARLVLLVVLRAQTALSGELELRIRALLRTEASASHVPALILAVPDLPITHSGKPSERAARDVLDGRPVANLVALRNPGSLAGISDALAAGRDVPAVSADAEAGRDEIETIVGRLWRESLAGRAEDAPPERSFTDLGGTSREAMTLVRRVRTTLGRDVRVDGFLADPTLPGLVAAARVAPRAADAPAVVPLAAGEPGLPPMFFVHDVYGDLDVYWSAAQLLTGTGPVHGLRTDILGPDGRRRSIPDLAAEHVWHVLKTVPDGPVTLAGHSFGGQVAFELASLLTAAGRHVEHVTLVDVRPAPSLVTGTERILNTLGQQLALLLVPSIRNVTRRQLLRQRLRPQEVDADGRLFAQAHDVVNRYSPGPHAGRVVYLMARRRMPLLQRWVPAWRRIAPDLTVVVVPGAHHDVLGQANVVETVARWSRTLAGLSTSSAHQ